MRSSRRQFTQAMLGATAMTLFDNPLISHELFGVTAWTAKLAGVLRSCRLGLIEMIELLRITC